MIKVGLGQAEGIDTREVVLRVIRRCREQMGNDRPQAGIVFAASEFDHALMLAEINRAFPALELIGCTTAGEFSSRYGYSDDSISLAVIYSDDLNLAAGVGHGLRDDHEHAVASAVAEARQGLSGKPAIGIALPDGFNTSFNRIIEQFNRMLPCPVIGGCAALQNISDGNPLQFFRDRVLTDAVPILLFEGPLEYNVAIANSWKPIGKRAVATETQGRIVKKINGIKALDFYQHYLGKHDFPAIEFPLAVYDSECGREYFYLRGPLAYNSDDGSITFTEAIPGGATVQLTEAERETMLADTENTTAWLQKTSQSFQPAFAMAFSCSLRKETLGTRTPEELAILGRHLPPKLPIMGFYSYGEIGPPVKGRPSLFHNATLVTLLIGQSSGRLPENAVPVAPHRQPASADAGPSSIRHQTDIAAKLKLENEFLRRKLKRSEKYRRRLEHIKDLNAVLHHQIIHEIEDARQEIARRGAELRKSEEKYRRIVETAGEGFILMDENLVIKDVNETYCRLLGFRREEIVGMKGYELASEDFRQYLQTNQDALLAKDYRKMEGTVISKSGAEIPVLIHGSTLRDSDGQFMGNMAFVTDMTEHKKALSLAGEVQKSLLPQTKPQIRGFDIAGRNVSCDEIGGDYFDFLWRRGNPEQPFSIVVGDIAGHGVDAALLMTSARAFLRMRASQPGTMADIINAMNRHLAEDVMQSGRFMSLFYLTIDPAARTIEWVRAGHDPALVYQPRKNSFETLMGHGMPLGVEKEFSYAVNHRADIPHGSIITVGTDGIWECFNKNGEMFGIERFQDVIRQHAGKSADDIVEAVFEALNQFSVGVPPADDITLVVVKCGG